MDGPAQGGERLDKVRLEAVLFPDAADRGFAQTRTRGSDFKSRVLLALARCIAVQSPSTNAGTSRTSPWIWPGSFIKIIKPITAMSVVIEKTLNISGRE